MAFSRKLLFAGIALIGLRHLSADAFLAEGDFLAVQGVYEEAITSYLKYLFYHPGDVNVSAAYHKISRAYAALGDAAAALRYADRALEQACNEAERRERAFSRAELLLAFGRYEPAVLELTLLEGIDLSTSERGRCWFLLGVAAVYRNRFGEAAAYFRDYFALTAVYPPETARRIIVLLDFGARSIPIDPCLAAFMSYILPGSGQVYAGDFFQGLNSFIITGATGALAVWALLSGSYIDAAVLVYFAFSRFYTGSPFHASRIATERNERRRRLIKRAVFNLLASETIPQTE